MLGSVADAFTLISHLEAKLDECGGNLQRACIELAKAWRTDRILRHLQVLRKLKNEKKCNISFKTNHN